MTRTSKRQDSEKRSPGRSAVWHGTRRRAAGQSDFARLPLVGSMRDWPFLKDLPDGRSVPRLGWRKRHFGILLFTWTLVPLLLVVGLYGQGHPVFGLDVVPHATGEILAEVAGVALLALVATLPRPSRRVRSIAAALSIAAGSALLVHLTSGLIEAHFLFLVGIAVISVYQDWMPLVLSCLLTVVHHSVVGVIEPTSVYNHPAALAQPVLWAFIHGVFVLGIAGAEVAHWRAMAQQRDHTDRVVATTTEGLVGLDEIGHVTFVNPAAERLLGRQEELVKQPASRVFAGRLPSLAETFGASRVHAVRSGRGVRFSTRDGSLRYVDWTSEPILEGDRFMGTVVTLRDVTERQLAESRLREQELQLLAAQHIAHVGSFEWAPVSGVLRVSEELVRILDNARVPRPARLETLDDLLMCIHPDDRAEVEEHLLLAHSHGLRFEVECRIGNDVDQRHCELRGQLEERNDPEYPERLVRGSCNDVTERVRAEEMRRRSLEKDQEIKILREHAEFKNKFINAVAHELNTPLTPVRLQLHLLKMDQDGMLSPRQQRAVSMLDRNIKRFSGLVDDLLDAARIQGGRLRVDPNPIDLSAVVEEAVDHFEGVMLEKDLVLETSIVEGLEVRGDHDRLLQVVYNLLSNACKFTPRGGTIEVGTRQVGDEIVFRVRDEGIGVTDEDQERLFQPFTQVQDHMESNETGTGLGLYLCRGIIELHDGRIWCESEGRGCGSVFAFALPVLRSPPQVVQVTPVADGATVQQVGSSDLHPDAFNVRR